MNFVGLGEFRKDGLQGGGEGVQAMENPPWRQGALLILRHFQVLCSFRMRSLEGCEEVADLEESFGAGHGYGREGRRAHGDYNESDSRSESCYC